MTVQVRATTQLMDMQEWSKKLIEGESTKLALQSHHPATDPMARLEYRRKANKVEELKNQLNQTYADILAELI